MIAKAVQSLGTGPLTEASIREHLWPLFSRVLASNKEIYLANHSLGRPLDQTAKDIARGVDLWYEALDGAWDELGWPSEMSLFRSRIAKLIGLDAGECVVPKTAAGQGLRAVLNALPKDGSSRPVNIVTTRGEFDSLDFILKTYIRKGRANVTWVDPSSELETVPLYDAESILHAIKPGVDLVIVSLVVFATGQVMPGLDAIIAKAHSVGAYVLGDTYHAAGVMPIEMEQVGLDFAVGGSYKYTRGGPGACWLAIHPSILEAGLRTLDTGWFAKKSPFSYLRPEEPELAEGGDAWLESTPPVLTMYQATAGLELTLGIGVDRLRTYNLHQQEILRSAFKAQKVHCVEPANPERFGAFALVPSPDPKALSKRLKEAGVNTDSRGTTVRFGPDILNTEEELIRAAEITAQVLNG